MSTITSENPNYRTPPSIIVTIIGVSAAASLFLAWLVYFHAPVDVAGTKLAFLPALEATLNAMCAIFLIFGYRQIMQRDITRHRNSMFGAFIVSSLFLVLYIVNKVLHGETHFPTTYPITHFFYLWVLLAPHIFLAVACLPMILITFFLSLTGRFPAHRKLARWTYPIWLYVAVSGVVVYAMLAAYK
jgi:putative membrane protein